MPKLYIMNKYVGGEKETFRSLGKYSTVVRLHYVPSPCIHFCYANGYNFTLNCYVSVLPGYCSLLHTPRIQLLSLQLERCVLARILVIIIIIKGRAKKCLICVSCILHKITFSDKPATLESSSFPQSLFKIVRPNNKKGRFLLQTEIERRFT